jgi:hypothetical protein
MTMLSSIDLVKEAYEVIETEPIKSIPILPSVKFRSAPLLQPIPQFPFTTVEVVKANSIDTALRLRELKYRPVLLNVGNPVFPSINDTNYECHLVKRSTLAKHMTIDMYPIESQELVFSSGVCVFRSSQYANLPKANLIDVVTCRGPMLEGSFLAYILSTAVFCQSDAVVIQADFFNGDHQTVSMTFRNVVREFAGSIKVFVIVAENLQLNKVLSELIVPNGGSINYKPIKEGMLI